jgi:hypothetical protein
MGIANTGTTELFQYHSGSYYRNIPTPTGTAKTRSLERSQDTHWVYLIKKYQYSNESYKRKLLQHQKECLKTEFQSCSMSTKRKVGTKHQGRLTKTRNSLLSCNRNKQSWRLIRAATAAGATEDCNELDSYMKIHRTKFWGSYLDQERRTGQTKDTLHDS